MNKDKVKGARKAVAGKIQEKAADKQQAKGLHVLKDRYLKGLGPIETARFT